MNNEDVVWEILRVDFTVIACAAIIGNLQAESALRPNNVQNSYESKLGTDQVYTERVDSGVYGREKFSHDCAGYGLAQWTHWSRKSALWDYLKSKKGVGISDLRGQAEFCALEIKGNERLYNDLNACTQLRQAVEIVLKRYERPADQSDGNVDRRTKLAGEVLARHREQDPDGTKKIIAELKKLLNKLEGLV